MKKPTILRTLIFVLALLFNFASYSQNLIAYNSVKKDLDENIYLRSESTENTDTIVNAAQNGISSKKVAAVNPLIKFAQAPYAGTVSTCPNDGELLPKFFICGSNNPRVLDPGITNATSISWQRLTGGCTSVPNANCANTLASCTWQTISTGATYDAGTAGQFRLRVVNADATISYFYFNVYTNDLDPTGIDKSNILRSSGCTIPGQITINGFNSNYEYGYSTAAVNNPGTTWQNSNIIPINTADRYNVFIRLRGVTGTCVFNVKNIEIERITFNASIVLSHPKCFGESGNIRVNTPDLGYQYRFELWKNGVYQRQTTTYTPEANFSVPSGNGYEVRSFITSNCLSNTDSNLTINNSNAQLTATPSITSPTSCTSGNIKVTTTGGTGAGTYQYYYKIGTGTEVYNGYNDVIVVTSPGTYSIRVVDANQCTVSATTTINTLSKPNYTISTVNPNCNSITGSIVINVISANGYTLNYTRSNNGGTQTGQTGYTYPNLNPGSYTVKVRYRVGNGSWCEDTHNLVINQPADALTASAGVAKLSGCGDKALGQEHFGLLRVTNPQGGTAPYQYKFGINGTYQNEREKFMEPGNHTLYIKDANGCEFVMPNIILEAKPSAPSIKKIEAVYNCDGSASATVTVENPTSSNYSYEYYMDDVLNTNVPNNVFVNVPYGVDGKHRIKVRYSLLDAKTPSNLLTETFGKGGPTTSPGINPAYCFEDQSGTHPPGYACNLDNNINDGEYAVTNRIIYRFGSWLDIRDHTSSVAPATQDPAGRFLAINIGGSAGEGGIIYRKPIYDVIPNQDVKVSLWVQNLINKDPQYADNDDPNITIELIADYGLPTQQRIASQATGIIPKTNKWENYLMNLNPGNYTTLDFVVRSYSIEFNGNDLTMDDIVVFQTPESCLSIAEQDFQMDPNKKFTGEVTGLTNFVCRGDGTAKFQIVAKNYDTNYGFDYTLDGTTWYNSKVGTVNVPTDVPVAGFQLQPKAYDVRIRYNNTATACSQLIPTTITSPDAFVIDATATVAKCDGGATVKATAVGGNGGYTITLTKLPGGTPLPFDLVNGEYILNGVSEGTYRVSGTDVKGCMDDRDTDLVITLTTGPTPKIRKDAGLCFDKTNGAKITVDIENGTGPFSYAVSRDLGVTYGQYSETFTDRSFVYSALTTGTYTFKVRDANGCENNIASQTINAQFGAKPGIKTELSCKTGATAATIEVNIEGGTAPYKYIVKNSAGTQLTAGTTTTNAFEYSTTIAGTYTFDILDENECPISINQEVKSITAITAKATTKDVTCYNLDNGYVDLEVLTGKAPYSYQFNGTGPFTDKTHYDNLKGSKAGITYSYTVKDANDCVETFTFKIFQPDPIAGVATMLPLYNCDHPATITVSGVSGGTGALQYTLYKDNVKFVGPQDGLTFSGLNVAGVYTVTITDANSCSLTVNAGTINALNPPTAMTISTTTAATCPNNQGSVTITNVRNAAGVAITGTLEYRILLPTAGTYQNSNVFNNLNANVEYTFEVKDANNCKATGKHTILLPESFTVGSKSTPIKCFGESNGTATYTVTGIASGTGYTYKVDGQPLQTRTSTGSPFDIVINGLSAGEHTIVVTNLTTNCPVTEKVIVGGATALLALATPDLTHVTCIVNGTADIKASNGSGSYTYVVTPTAPAGTALSQTTSKFTNLGAGAYSVVVTDLTGCTATQNFTINDFVLPSATISATSDYCAVGTGATLIAEPTAAPKPNPNYEYRLNPSGAYQASGTFDKLIPGKYTIRVRDKVTGCTADLAEQTIATPVSASAKIITDLTCDPTSPEAVIEVSIENGYPNYRYRVSTSTTFTGGYTDLGAGVTKFTVNRLAGTYYFEITDSKDCVKVISQVVNSTVKPDFDTKLVAVKCKGDSTGSITVEGIPASGTYTYVLNTIPATTAVTQTTSNVFSGLKAGNYSIFVIDAKKCQSDAKTVTITEPVNGLTASATPTATLECDAANGAVAAKITVTASGGTPYAAPDLYRYSYNGQTPVTSNVYSTTASGPVSIEVFDASGCSFTVPSTINIAPLDPPTGLTITSSNVITCAAGNANLRLEFTNGVSPFTYEITNPTASIVSVNDANRNHTFTGLTPGHYYFKVTDANKCTVTGDFDIKDVVGIQTNGGIVSNVTCNGADNGSIKFTVAGNRTGGYTYTLVNSKGTITSVPGVSGDVITYSGLEGGEKYKFTVTNTATQCSANAEVTLAEPVAITAFTAKASNIYCNYTRTDITVSATAIGTTLYYAVVKSTDPAPTFPGGYQTSGNFTKDTAIDGVSYTAYVVNKDGNCMQSVTVPVLTDAEPKIDPITASLCYSGTNFTVKITGSVYAGAILYGLNGSYDTNDTKTITGPGKYTLGVKDDHGCEKTIEIDVNKQLTIGVRPDKGLTCEVIAPFTTTDALFTLSAGGGVGPYTYRVSYNGGGYTTTGITGSTFTTSQNGDYRFEATDSNTPACSVISAIVKVEPLVLPEITSVVQSQKILCSTESTGAIKVTLNPSKGTAPFTYEVSLKNAPFTNFGAQMSSLPAGEYIVKVTDAKGCTDTEEVEIKKPTPIIVDYEVIGLQCDPAGGISKGSIIIKSVTGGTVTSPSVPGTTGYNYYVTGTNYNKSELNADGTTSVTFDIVDFGLYKIVVSDENGCSVEFPDELVASVPNKLNITVTSPPANCDTTLPGGGGGSATVEVGSAFAGSGPFYFSIYKGSNVAFPAGTWQLEDVDGLGVGLKKTTFTNLTPGVKYTYVVYDSQSRCYYYETGAPAIPTNSTLTASTAVPQNVTCADATDGAVSFDVTSIYPTATNFTYEIFNALTHVTTNVVGSGTVAANSTIKVTSLQSLDLGFYYVLIKEVGASPNTGCSIVTTSFKIDKSSKLLTIKATLIKNATCGKLGTISAEARDGTAAYKYQAVPSGTAIDPTKWVDENSFDLAGSVGTGISYDIYVKDANNCIKYDVISLPQDPIPAFHLAIVNSCAAEGSLEVNVIEDTKGIEPYYISVNGEGFKFIDKLPYTITGLKSGPVDVIIKDFNGCETSVVKSPITPKPTAIAKVDKVLNCSGPTSNATIKVDISDGTGPFTYEVYKDGALLTGGPFAVTLNTFNYSVASTAAGKYVFEISDNNTCKTETSEVIINPLVTIVPDSDTVLASCFGGNGTITLSAIGGQKPYKFSFNGLPFSDDATYSAVAGTYSFIVRDALGCEVSDNVNLAVTPDLVLGTPTIDQPKCGPNNAPQQAKIVLAATGGTGTIEYSFNNGGFSTENTYYYSNETGTSQSISYAVRDANNCTKTSSVTILWLDAPTGFTMTPANVITCQDLTTTVTISNVDHGIAPFTYQIISPTASAVDNLGTAAFSNLLPGVYVFQVTDANGCTKQLQYEIKDVVKIKIEKQSSTDITCLGANDGKASFLVTGFGTGVGTYNYVLDTNAAVTMTTGTINLTNLTLGSHTITVQDDETKCSTFINFNIGTPTIALDFSMDVTPLGCKTFGAVKISATNGWGDYVYTVTEPAPASTVLPSNTTGEFGGLTKVGIYSVSVKDAKGCIETKTFELLTPINPVATIDPTSVYCYSAAGSTLIVNASTTSTFDVKPYEYSIDNGATWQTSETFKDLVPGDYQVTVKDKFGCIATAVDTRINGQLYASGKVDKEIFCAPAALVNGLIKVEAVGGYAPYTYTVTKDGVLNTTVIPFPTPTATIADYVVTPTESGTYIFTITDSKGCSYPSAPVVIGTPTPVTFTATPTSPYCVSTPAQGNSGNGQILVELTSVKDNPDYTYTLTRTSPTGMTAMVQTNNGLFTGLIAGTYDVTVVSARGCDFTQTGIVIAPPTAVLARATPSAFECTPGNAIKETIVTLEGSGGAGTAGVVTDYLYSDNGTDWYTTNQFKVYDTQANQHFTYYVKDKNGCIDDVEFDVLAFPKLFSATPSLVTLADCTNNGEETIKVDIVGGAIPYRFEYQVAVDGGTYGTPTTVTAGNNSFNYVAPNAGHTYQFKITDLTTGCTVISSAYEVKLFDLMKVNATASSMVSCNGLSDGTITLNIQDYAKTYDYNVLLGGVIVKSGSVDAAVDNPFIITGLGAGIGYTVQVLQKDYPNCDGTSNPVTITQPDVLDISGIDVKVKNQNCNNTGATITVDPLTITGGTKAYEVAFLPLGTPVTDGDYFQVFTKTVVTTATATTPDTWVVYVRDKNGCPESKTVTLFVDPMPAITNVQVDTQCANNAGYKIEVTANGVGTLEYSLDGVDYQLSNILTVSNAGNYRVWVRDANQCTVQATTAFTVLQPLTLDVDSIKLPVCKNADGEVTLVATGGTVAPNSYVFIRDGGAPQPSPTFTGLASGDYKFVVRDIVTLCEKEIDVNIPTPTDILGMVATPKPVSCNGGQNGSISIAIADTNNNPVYKYSIVGGTINITDQTTPIFNNLPTGTYRVTVRSGRGCEDFRDVFVPEPLPIVVTASNTEFGCSTGTNTKNNATITVNTVTGGSERFVIYEFKKGTDVLYAGPLSSYTVTDTAGGTFTVTVYDDNNCQGTNTTPLIIKPFASLDEVTFTVKTPITCENLETVQVNVASTGALLSALRYTLTGANNTVITPQVNNTGEFSGLGVGNYLVEVFNPDTNCTISNYHNVADPNTFEIVATPIRVEVCYGDADGAVDLTFVDNLPTPSNEAGIFDYTITGPVPSSGRTTNAGPIRISNLTVGQYNVVAKLVGSPGCTVTTSFSINQPIEPLQISVTKADITCIATSDDGAISAVATGGWDDIYQYQLVKDGAVIKEYAPEFDFTGLSFGNYIVNVKDGKGCVASAPIVLSIPQPIIVTASASATTLLCFGDKNATITVDLPTGGQGTGYLYTLNITSANPVIVSGPQESPIFTGLGAGTYTVTVTDGFNCEATSASITIGEPAIVVPSIIMDSSNTCLTDARITLNATGGTGPYTYSEDGVTYSASFNSSVTFSVTVGSHRYYVKDVNGCTSFISDPVEVNPITPLTITLDKKNAHVNCTGDNSAVITATAVGGLGNYEYSLLNNLAQVIRPAQADGYFPNLTAGTYTVHVKSVDCEKDEVFTVTESPNPLIVTHEAFPVKCFGDKNGSIVVTATGGTGVIKYAISPNLDQFVESGTFTGLEAGTYTVLVQDILGCLGGSPFTIIVDQPGALIASEILSARVPELCQGDKDGAFSVQVSGGTPSYSVSLDNEKGVYTPGAVGQTRFDFTNQAGGIHNVYIKDANGCIAQVEINMPLPVILNPTVEVNYDCVNNTASNLVTVTIDPSNTDASLVKYELDGIAATDQDSNIFVNVAPGVHYVIAIHDNGCFQRSADFTIKTVDPLTLALSSGQQEMNIISVTAAGGSPAYEYSFNGEPFTSSNKYKIYKSGDYKVIVRDQNGCTSELIVPAIYVDVCLDNYFTPNGDGVYDTWGPGCTNIYNNLEFSIFDRYGRVIAKYHYGQKWDGRYNGAELPSGDYWYVLKLNDEKDNREFVGHFTLYR